MDKWIKAGVLIGAAQLLVTVLPYSGIQIGTVPVMAHGQTLIIGILMLMTWAAIGVGYWLSRLKEPEWEPPAETIANKQFKNEIVNLLRFA
jgi:hypothetical protein